MLSQRNILVSHIHCDWSLKVIVIVMIIVKKCDVNHLCKNCSSSSHVTQASRQSSFCVQTKTENVTRYIGWKVGELPRAAQKSQYTGWPQIWHTNLYALSLAKINRFSKLFHCQNQEKICNNTTIKKISPHLKCVTTLLCEMSSVLKATVDNKTTSVTTHSKKLATGNNVFIVSVIV